MLPKFSRNAIRTTRASITANARVCIANSHSLAHQQTRYCASNTTSVENHEFKAETRKLLDIVAKSLYTDKEVFIRELISNASDALEKFRFLSSTQQITNIANPDSKLGITVEVDPKNRTFTIIDSGIGMSKSELVDNLGTIARSGSKKFLEEVGSSDNKIIGQFGVGFYSSFVVADRVRVFSRSADSDRDAHGYLWESDGSGTFSVTRDDSISRGSRIEIHLKEESADFSNYEIVKSAATKFSSFIDFPLKIKNNETNEETDITQQEALWLKTCASEEEHTEFYRFLTGNSYGEPHYSLFFHTDAPLSIKSVFYVPEESPDRYFQQTAPKSGIALHSRRVLVTKHADSIIPQWLFWVRGVVDCEDMPLNISRENMQDTALLRKLSNAIVKRILRFLIDESKRNPEKFTKFYKNYSTFLKAGLLEDIRVHGGSLHKDQLMKLLRFELVNPVDGKSELVSLDEYVSMTSEAAQKTIYYANAPSRKSAQLSPYMDGLENVPVLLLTDDIDDFVVNSIGPFKERMFVSIDSGDVADRQTAGEPAGEGMTEENKNKIIELFKNNLKENKKINEVIFNSNLKSSPAVVTSQLSPHMRKMMKNIIAQAGPGQSVSDGDLFDAMPVKIELSESDPMIQSLANLDDSDPVAKLTIQQIYYNAMISAGMVEDAKMILGNVNEILKIVINQSIRSKTN
jgi:TNF receptor-associated protein 1